MLRVYAPLLMSAIADMKAVALGFTLIQNDQERDVSRAGMIECVATVKRHLDVVPLSSVLRNQLERLDTAANVEPPNYDVRGVHVMSREFYINLIEELNSSLFLAVPESRRSFWEQPDPPFGQNVADKYPTAERDIRAAARCLALDEWTACVFHLMRVLELGLRDMALQLNIQMGADIDYLQWGELIDQINAATKAIGQEKKSRKRNERQRFYGEAASNFDHFKNAWRNHVSHSRDHYDERDAVTIWNHVMTFMQVLASGPS